MKNQSKTKINKPYVVGVLALTLLLPILSVFIEKMVDKEQSITFLFIGKWFIFYAVGFRLLMAGIKQISNPAFTARDIFQIEDKSSYIIVKELGFANLCFGFIGIISLFLPEWRVVSAFGSGLYFGLAALNHFIRKSAGANELFALITDIFIFIVLLIYFLLNL